MIAVLIGCLGPFVRYMCQSTSSGFKRLQFVGSSVRFLLLFSSCIFVSAALPLGPHTVLPSMTSGCPTAGFFAAASLSTSWGSTVFGVGGGFLCFRAGRGA